MKRLYALVFVFLFMIQSAGFLVLFEMQRYSVRKDIKQQIKEGVPENELKVFRIPLSELAEFEKNFIFFESNEFELEGKMYDVVRSETVKNVKIFYCLEDEQESILFAGLNNLVEKTLDNSADEQNQRRNFTFLISLVYLPVENSIFLKETFKADKNSSYTFSIKEWNNSPTSPPPLLV